MRSQPTQEQLLDALRISRCTVSLADALASQALALALTNTAIAIARRHTHSSRPRPVDHKRLAAGDID